MAPRWRGEVPARSSPCPLEAWLRERSSFGERRGSWPSDAVLGLAACKGYPRDPDGTLDRVLATDLMRVVAVDHPPWVVAGEGATPTGVEAELVQALARELGVAVEWRRAPAFEALDALDHGEADLAVGGFTQKEVDAYGIAAGTYAYFTQETAVAAKPGAPPRDIDGRRVLSPDLAVAGLVRAEGGIPVAEGKGADLVALPGGGVPRATSRPRPSCPRRSFLGGPSTSWPCRRARTPGSCRSSASCAGTRATWRPG